MLNELKVDGIIASDGGVIDVIKKEAPDIDIHISTQKQIRLVIIVQIFGIKMVLKE